MPSAVGHLRYGPSSVSVPRKGYWLVLECDRDWFHWHGSAAQRSLPPQFICGPGDTPKMGITRPTLCPPAWGPHISIVRGERPKNHTPVWDLAVRAGDVRDQAVSRREAARAIREKLVHLQAALDNTVKPKARQELEATIPALLRQANGLETDSRRTFQRDLPAAQANWRQAATSAGVPHWLAPGVPIEFEYDPVPRTSGHHWWFMVTCEALLDLREVYGIRRAPRVPLHLTFAVHEGVPED